MAPDLKKAGLDDDDVGLVGGDADVDRRVLLVSWRVARLRGDAAQADVDEGGRPTETVCHFDHSALRNGLRLRREGWPFDRAGGEAGHQ